MLDAKQTIFIEMAMLINQFRNHLDEAFKAHDLSRQEWLILGLLRAKAEGISQSYVKAYLSVETSYLTKLLNGLEERGLITRHIDPNDRRNRIIRASKSQAKKLQTLFKIITQFNEAIGADLTKADVAHMQSCFDKMHKQLKQQRSSL